MQSVSHLIIISSIKLHTNKSVPNKRLCFISLGNSLSKLDFDMIKAYRKMIFGKSASVICEL